MASRQPFTGVDQVDAAFVESGGVAYRCYVWLRNEVFVFGDESPQRGVELVAMCFTEQAHGQSVLLFHNIVRTPASGVFVDSPRIIAQDDSFVVHWVEYDPTATVGDPTLPAARNLFRATLDVTAGTFAWTNRGSITTHYYTLYDVYTEDGGSEYLVAHASDIDAISFYRVNGATWVDNDWIQTASLAPDELAPRCLACYYESTSSAVAVYQQNGTTALYGVSRTWSDGSAASGPSAVTGSLGEFGGAGLCRSDASDVSRAMLVAEYEEDSINPSMSHWTVHGEIDVDSLSTMTEQRVPNTTLNSKPWAYAGSDSTVSPEFNMFAVLGFRGEESPNDWQQANHYVVRYDPALLGRSNDAGRPIPVASLNQGLANTGGLARIPRVSSGPSGISQTPNRRLNHLASASQAPSFGPLMKTRTIPLIRWTRIESYSLLGELALEPAGAAVRGVRFHHEDPWLYHRDVTDPPQPTRTFSSVSVPMLESVPAGAGLFLGGGMPSSYDGRKIVEAGFAWYPEITDVQIPSGGPHGSGLSEGTYQYTAVYEWRDARGQSHRSQPATPVSIEVDDPGVDQFRHVELNVRTINLSLKDHEGYDSLANPIKIEIYRTLPNGSIFYPLFRNDTGGYSVEDTPINNPRDAAVYVLDEVTNDSLEDSIPLTYSFATTGVWSPLAAEPIPAMAVLARWQNRVWGVSSEQPNVLWYSLEILPEQGGEQYTIPEFNVSNTYRIDGIGTVTAMEVMDNNLIIFTRDGIYSLYGTPNDGTGAGANLQLQVLQRNTGCIEPRSVGVAHDGLYFQSRRGFYKLARGNTLEYVGADVEDDLRAAGNIRAVTVHEDSHQVRVVCNTAIERAATVLVYDWLFQMWSKWSLPTFSGNSWLSSTQDAVSWRGHDGEHAHVVLAQGGLGIQKSSYASDAYVDESSADATVAIPVDVRTGWIKLAGIAGFKRVRKIGLQLTKPNASGLRVDIEYDRDGTYTTGANLQTVILADPAPEYIELRTNVQKCSAIRVRVYEDTAIGQTNTVALHALTLVVARKPGLRRVAATQRGT